MSRPTQPMQDYIGKLLKMKQWDQTVVLSIAPQREMTFEQGSKLIDYLKGCDWRPRNGGSGAGQRKSVTEDGMYKTGDGTIYKVYWNREGSRLLAKKGIVRPAVDGESAKIVWEYVGLASRFVDASERMPYEVAKEFGALYGICIYGHPLNNEVSIYLGIGPVCGRNQYGDSFDDMVRQAEIELGIREA